jgi:uncharacterized protein (DUF1330 family)
VDSYIATAKAAAGTDWAGTFLRLCIPPSPGPQATGGQAGAGRGAGGRGTAVRGGKTEALEGEPPKRIIVIAFKSMADAQRWYASPEYSAIRPIRQRTAKARGFIVEGLGE